MKRVKPVIWKFLMGLNQSHAGLIRTTRMVPVVGHSRSRIHEQLRGTVFQPDGIGDGLDVTAVFTPVGQEVTPLIAVFEMERVHAGNERPGIHAQHRTAVTVFPHPAGPVLDEHTLRPDGQHVFCVMQVAVHAFQRRPCLSGQIPSVTVDGYLLRPAAGSYPPPDQQRNSQRKTEESEFNPVSGADGHRVTSSLRLRGFGFPPETSEKRSAAERSDLDNAHFPARGSGLIHVHGVIPVPERHFFRSNSDGYFLKHERYPLALVFLYSWN